MSGDGTALLALADQGLPYYSGDGGVHWDSARLFFSGPFSWAGAAISGNMQAAAVRGGNIWHNFNAGPQGWYTSNYIDRGLPQRQQWSSLALAKSGPSNYTLAATVAGGGIQVVSLVNLSADPSGLMVSYRYTPVGEVATGTTGNQMWTGVAAFPSGALVAVASRSPWGIYHSDDGRMWMPRMRCGAHCVHARHASSTTELLLPLPDVRHTHAMAPLFLWDYWLPVLPVELSACRGLRRQTFTNLRSTSFPIDYSKLTPAGDAVVPRPDASNVGNFTVLLVSRQLAVPAFQTALLVWDTSSRGTCTWVLVQH